jgi:hypothetical protein
MKSRANGQPRASAPQCLRLLPQKGPDSASGSATILRAATEKVFQPRQFARRSHDAVIRVYDESGNVIETHEHNGNFKEP